MWNGESDTHKWGLTDRKSLVEYRKEKEKEKEKKEMRKPPKTSTILKSIIRYAYNAGFTYHPQTDGTIRLFDIHMGYYVFRGSRERVAQFIVDELWAKYFRLTHS